MLIIVKNQEITNKMKKIFIIILLNCALYVQAQDFEYIAPQLYLCNKTDSEVVIDGKLDDGAWNNAEWTNLFVDIEGDKKPKPYFDTRAKMLWDNNYMYFAFEIKDEHIWAKLTNRDTVIFYDNDIEIFIDPSGDTHNYFEFELNAFNTIWDLFLAKPYREGGPVINDFDFKGIQTGVKIDGTLNNPNDIDKAWYVEVAIPWKSIVVAKYPKKVPENGESMRVNFSRVQWETEVIDGKYVKKKNESGKILSENNWVWSPIGAIDMHRPEYWGIVTFIDKSKNSAITNNFIRSEDELRQVVSYVYKQQKSFRYKNGRFAKTLKELQIPKLLSDKYDIRMNVLRYSFEIVGTDKETNTSWLSNTEGKLTKLK